MMASEGGSSTGDEETVVVSRERRIICSGRTARGASATKGAGGGRGGIEGMVFWGAATRFSFDEEGVRRRLGEEWIVAIFGRRRRCVV
jgi:hypothetical protein